MTKRVRYLTHPQVEIDPAVPVPLWRLSATGMRRIAALVGMDWLRGTTQIVSSAERKALETATPIAAALGLEVEVRAAMHENDRSATGFLPSSEFEAVADAFFARPTESVRGWERAVDAQARIVREVEAILSRNLEGDVLIVGHGAVGTLLFCYHSGIAISRVHDQQAGGGCYFAFTCDSRRVLHPWRPIEMPPMAEPD